MIMPANPGNPFEPSDFAVTVNATKGFKSFADMGKQIVKQITGHEPTEETHAKVNVFKHLKKLHGQNATFKLKGK